MVPWDRDRAADAARHDSRREPGETVDASHIQTVLAAARRPRARPASTRSGPTRATGSISSSASSGIQLYYQGSLLDDAERAAVEPAAQRLSRHRAVGRLGLVGRHRDVVEDARGADRGRPQLLAEHRPVLGLGHRRLLSEPRVHRRALRALVPVRGVLRIVPLARPHVVDAPAVGLGRQRASGRSSTATTTRRRRPAIARNIDPAELEQPGHRADRQDATPSCAIS